MPPQRILLVEDDGDLREAVSEILEEESYAVTVACDGREGVDLLRMDPAFCLVLLDMRMPVMTGLDFRREQLRDPRIARVPVVAFSAGAGDRSELAFVGIDRVLSKPVDLLQLLEAVADECGGTDRLERPGRRERNSGTG